MPFPYFVVRVSGDPRSPLLMEEVPPVKSGCGLGFPPCKFFPFGKGEFFSHKITLEGGF